MYPKRLTGAIVRKTCALIKQSLLPLEVKKSFNIREAVPPRLYRLSKIHKANVLLWTIVSTIGSLMYGLAQHLASLLQPFIGGRESYFWGLRHFIEKLSIIALELHILVSFDVVTLFTMVPVREYIGDNWKEVSPVDITPLFSFYHVLTMMYFQWDGQFFNEFTVLPSEAH